MAAHTRTTPPKATEANPEPRRRGRPPRTEQQRAEQRARLIDSAIEAIRSTGPDISIDDLALFAGVSKPVLYDEFGGKLGLADAIAVQLAERLERQLLADITLGDGFDMSSAVRAVVSALIDIIEELPEVYAFVVRSIRSSDRGFLDNALVQVIHQRGEMLVGIVAPGVPPAHLSVLTDGLFGFVFASVESWQATKELPKAELVTSLTTVIQEGLRSVAELFEAEG